VAVTCQSSKTIHPYFTRIFKYFLCQKWANRTFIRGKVGVRSYPGSPFTLTQMATSEIPNKSAPIGIFDSGVGGLTVARAIIDQLPGESILYLGDTARGPYGVRPLAQVRSYALEIMDQLVAAGVKAIVIACNTASAAMLRDARERYQIPVIEVIQPAVRRAVSATRSGKVGVIGTNATIDSKAYLDAFAAAPQLSITSKACPLFVEFVENGKTTGHEITKIAQDYLSQMKTAQIDTLVLGCTHYPLLTGVISYVMGNDVTLVSSAEETAKDLYRTLVETNLLNDQSGMVSHRFVATGDPVKFATLAKRFLGPEVVTVTNKI
jgi:glutamate racemase